MALPAGWDRRDRWTLRFADPELEQHTSRDQAEGVRRVRTASLGATLVWVVVALIAPSALEVPAEPVWLTSGVMTVLLLASAGLSHWATTQHRRDAIGLSQQLAAGVAALVLTTITGTFAVYAMPAIMLTAVVGFSVTRHPFVGSVGLGGKLTARCSCYSRSRSGSGRSCQSRSSSWPPRSHVGASGIPAGAIPACDLRAGPARELAAPARRPAAPPILLAGRGEHTHRGPWPRSAGRGGGRGDGALRRPSRLHSLLGTHGTRRGRRDAQCRVRGGGADRARRGRYGHAVHRGRDDGHIQRPKPAARPCPTGGPRGTRHPARGRGAAHRGTRPQFRVGLNSGIALVDNPARPRCAASRPSATRPTSPPACKHMPPKAPW